MKQVDGQKSDATASRCQNLRKEKRLMLAISLLSRRRETFMSFALLLIGSNLLVDRKINITVAKLTPRWGFLSQVVGAVIT